MPAEQFIEILGEKHEIKRLTLKGWTSLEGIKKEMDEDISHKDFDNYYLALVRFIEMSLSSPQIDWGLVPWYEAITAYSQVVKLNSPTLEFPILIGAKGENKKLPWEYDGRAWYFWLHLFAKFYGWSEDAIGNLDIDTAIGLYQETQIDEQMEREWTYSLSETAYPYNQATKKQEYKPLARPEWMLPIAPKHNQTIMIRKDLMPMGNIVNLTDKKKEMSGI
jgi:hypothetical protein